MPPIGMRPVHEWGEAVRLDSWELAFRAWVTTVAREFYDYLAVHSATAEMESK